MLMYILFILNGRKTRFDLKIKHFLAVGTSNFVVLGILYNELKTNTATLMAQEGAIVQIKYIKTCFSSVMFLLRQGTEKLTFP